MKQKLPFFIKKIDESKDFRYCTIATVVFPAMGFKPEDFSLYDCNNKMVAKCTDGNLTVYPGYKWDGCTVIGNLTETPETLYASIPHDIYYIAKKNLDGVKLNYSLNEVDRYFFILMDSLYKNAGKNSCRPKLYFTGLKLLGWPWHYNKVKGYRVEK